MGEILDWVIVVFIVATAAVITLWMAGAIYYDICSEARWGGFLAAGWVGSVILLFAVWQPLWQPLAGLTVVLVLFLVWWFGQKPSHDRDWDPTVVVMPRAVLEGEVVTFENVRNFDYRSLNDFTPRYEARKYHLANLQGVDAIFFVWDIDWMGHPVLVFDFGPDGRVCMSIEARFRRDQRYSVIRSLFRQYELIFLVADERDVILRRTKHNRGQEAYLYRIAAESQELRAVFLDYVEAINRLYETPRWYHGLFTNCTTSFYRLPSTRWRFDWRVIANGRLDKALYEAGRLDRSLPFAELRRTAFLNEIANSAPEEGFGDHIRREIDRRRQER
jgi:Domain of unknown function (DUF4105)